MERVVAGLHHPTVRLHRRLDVGGLERELDGPKAEVLEDPNLPQGALNHRLGDVVSIFRFEVGFQASGIYTYAYGHLGREGRSNDFLDFPRLPDVAGVQAQPVDARIQGP